MLNSFVFVLLFFIFVKFATLTCVRCPTGSVAHDEYQCVLICEAWYCDRLVDCLACGPGTIAGTDPQNCKTCDPGTYSNSNNTECLACSAGQETNINKTGCSDCEIGYYNPQPSQMCEKCNIGTYAPNPGSTNCLKCPMGSFQNMSGESFCYPCGVGKYNPSSNSWNPNDCLICPIKYYCPNDMTAQPIICPKNHYCDSDGLSTPKKCPVFRVSNEGESKCQFSIAFIAITASFCVIVIGIIILVVRLKIQNKKEKQKLLRPEKLPENETLDFSELRKVVPMTQPNQIVYSGL
ncbi:thimet oligopeptidase [Anaeramoeba ignava]|uniref:Thimet oligopeptidase n=1 Tax=Anaeramoeba ignava TaxID=1746090 RepID=A0A9Q0R9X3_ANAIG|nr:thimet oligopeptidase [Anaeramoeba ignava]|eukprot:Anaeramoba_ignava/a614774_25.p1 GENE.a614774_25~~a614774_25.p1  ORF type:complete len:293 (-),score=67.66 a614774_25:72-950(-)